MRQVSEVSCVVCRVLEGVSAARATLRRLYSIGAGTVQIHRNAPSRAFGLRLIMHEVS